MKNALNSRQIANVMSVVDGHWKLLQKYQKNGPLVNSEFYTGWATAWNRTLPGAENTNQTAQVETLR